jgi:hypothetical protein
MKLDDVDGDVFGLMVSWIYYQEIKNEDIEIKAQAEAGSSFSSNAKVQSNTNKNFSTNSRLIVRASVSTPFVSPIKAQKMTFQLRVAKLWVLGQRFLIPDLQNEAVKKLLPLLVLSPGKDLKEVVEYAYSGEYDELRMLAAEVLAFSGWDSRLDDILEQLSQPVLADVTKFLRKLYSKVVWSHRPSLTKPEFFFVAGKGSLS